MMKRRLVWVGLFLSIALIAKAETASLKDFTIGNLAFRAPTNAKVQEIGVNAYEAGLPDPAGGKESGASVTLVYMPKEEVAQRPAGSHMPDFKATFLGTLKPAEKQVSRSFGGKTIVGEGQQGKIPKPLTLEAYRIDQPDGSALFVGMRRLDSFVPEKAEALFQAVAASVAVKKP